MTSAQLEAIGCERLLRSAIATIPKTRRKHDPLWAIVKDICCVGSTSGYQICQELGWNPDAKGDEPLPKPGDLPIKRSAVFSKCRHYRYELRRSWDNSKPLVNFVCLNPSTGDDTDDDHTIRRCIGYAQNWGYGSLVITNLYAYRATKPIALTRFNSPEGPENWEHVLRCAQEAQLIVAAWGCHKMAKHRHKHALAFFQEHSMPLHYIKLSERDGYPCHPLMLMAGLQPMPLNHP